MMVDSKEDYAINVWHRFNRTMSDGKVVKFKVQDISDAMADDVAEFVTTYYVKEENCCRAAGVANDPEAIAEYKTLLPSLVKARLSLVCLLDEEAHEELREESKDRSRRPPVIVGVNILIHREKGVVPEFGEIKSKANSTLLSFFQVSFSKEDIYTKYDVTQYLGGAGLSVHPDFRGLGIAVEILKARIPLCKHLGYKVTAADFTSIASQMSATKAGYEEYSEISYEILSQNTGVTFPPGTESIKMMAIAIPK